MPFLAESFANIFYITMVAYSPTVTYQLGKPGTSKSDAFKTDTVVRTGQVNRSLPENKHNEGMALHCILQVVLANSF